MLDRYGHTLRNIHIEFNSVKISPSDDKCKWHLSCLVTAKWFPIAFHLQIIIYSSKNALVTVKHHKRIPKRANKLPECVRFRAMESLACAVMPQPPTKTYQLAPRVGSNQTIYINRFWRRRRRHLVCSAVVFLLRPPCATILNPLGDGDAALTFECCIGRGPPKREDGNGKLKFSRCDFLFSTKW